MARQGNPILEKLKHYISSISKGFNRFVSTRREGIKRNNLNFITTIFNMRGPGMTMRRLPLFVFVWSVLVTAFLGYGLPFGVTRFTQFFWSCLFLFTFYIPICNDGDGVLGISRILKLRNQLVSHRENNMRSNDPKSLKDILRKGFSTGVSYMYSSLFEVSQWCNAVDLLGKKRKRFLVFTIIFSLILVYCFAVYFNLYFDRSKGNALPLYILISGGASCIFFRYLAETRFSRFISLVPFLLSIVAAVLILYKSQKAIILSFLCLSIAFLPFIQLDIIFIIFLLGRTFVHSELNDLGMTLLIEIVCLDFFFFFSTRKKKPFFSFLVGSLFLLLGYRALYVIDSAFTLKILLPIVASCTVFFLFGATTAKAHFFSYLGHFLINVLCIGYILSKSESALVFGFLNLFSFILFYLLAQVRGQPLSHVIAQQKGYVFSVYTFLIFLFSQSSSFSWLPDWVTAMGYQVSMIFLLTIIFKKEESFVDDFMKNHLKNAQIFLSLLFFSLFIFFSLFFFPFSTDSLSILVHK